MKRANDAAARPLQIAMMRAISIQGAMLAARCLLKTLFPDSVPVA